MIWLAVALAAEPSVSGFVEARGAYTTGVDGVPWQAVQRFRPTLQVPLGKHLLFATTPEFFLTQGRRLQSELERTITESEVGALTEGLCAWPRETNEALGISDVGDTLFVDRLYVDVYTSAVDVRIGRQALQWGSGLLINPTDPFPEILFNEPWRPRRGLNSARATIPIGERHQVQLVVGTDDLFTKVRAAARGTLNVGGFDLSLVGAYRQDANNGIVGLDVRGTAGVGLWFEGALHLGEGGYGTGIYEEIVVGLDYSVPVLQRFLVAGQYVRSGRQAARSGVIGRALDDVHLPDCDGIDVASALGGTEVDVDPFVPALQGNHYLLLMSSVGFVPELSLSAIWLQNLGDGTGLVVPTLTARPTGFLDVAFSAQVPVKTWGNGGEFVPQEDDLVLQGSLGLTTVTVDASGLVPTATMTLWTRLNF